MVLGDGRDAKGLTLLEVMIALGIFSVGILAVAAMQNVGMAALTSARRGSDCSRQAAVRIEEILSMDYDDPMLADADNGYHPQAPDHGPFDLPTQGATIEWEVDDDFPVPGAKRIGVTARPAPNGSRGRPFTYEYVKARDLR